MLQSWAHFSWSIQNVKRLLTDALVLAAFGGVLIGLLLTLFGGGGSVLATPWLIYVVGLSDTHTAIGTSAAAVAVNAATGLAAQARAGRVKWPCAITFGIAGLAGSLVGAQLAKQVDGKALLMWFAVAMIAIAISMLIPKKRQGNPAVAKGDTGPWRNAWKSLDLEHTLTPVKLDELKPVIHNDTVAQLASGDDNGMRVLSSEYKTELIILAIAEPDVVSKTMAITLVGQDAVGAINLKRTYRMSDGDVAYASEFAAVIALGVLEGRWKAVKSQTVAAFSPSPAIERPAWTAGSSAGGEQVRFVAEFASLAQWNEIRAQLLDTPGVEDLEIATVSARNADVILRFPGGAAALANSVGARGLALGNAGAGWTLRATY